MGMDRRARVFLTVLKDGRWHLKFPLAEIPIWVVEACFDLGLVERRLTRDRGTRNSTARFRITEKGRKALVKGKRPTRDDLMLARRIYVLGETVVTRNSIDRDNWRRLNRSLNAR